MPEGPAEMPSISSGVQSADPAAKNLAQMIVVYEVALVHFAQKT